MKTLSILVAAATSLLTVDSALAKHVKAEDIKISKAGRHSRSGDYMKKVKKKTGKNEFKGRDGKLYKNKSWSVVTKITYTLVRKKGASDGSVPGADALRLRNQAGCQQDQAGHLIAKRFGGKGSQDNFIPLYKNTNGNLMNKAEEKVARWVAHYGWAKVKIKLVYDDKDRPARPSYVEYHAWTEDCSTSPGKHIKRTITKRWKNYCKN